MDLAEFEEKDFEGPLYGELRNGSHRIATPGQVFEGRFGIDAAIEALNPIFWSQIGYRHIPNGVILDDLNWGFIWRRLGRRRRLPTFKTNLLIQAKRPKIRIRVTKAMSKLNVHGAHWCYDITQHQQVILEKVSTRLGNRALLVYASPAFDTLDDLYDHTENQTIVPNTNFVKVPKLSNHQSWHYFGPGFTGLAHSEPEQIEDKELSEFFTSLRGELPEDEPTGTDASAKSDYYEDLHDLHDGALTVCREEQDTNVLARYYLKIQERVTREMNQSQNESIKPFVGFSTFCSVFRLFWAPYL